MYKNHIIAYNDFLMSIPNIVRAIPSLEINNIRITISDVTIDRPVVAGDRVTKLLPQECIEGLFSYRGRLRITLHVSENGQEWYDERYCGYFPVMVGSVLCHHEVSEEELLQYYDDMFVDRNDKLEKGPSVQEDVSLQTIKEPKGGYFIINGMERVVRFLIVPKRNYPHLINRESFKKKHKMFTAKAVQFRSVFCEVGHVFFFHLLTNENVMIRFAINRREFIIPVILVLKALKDVTDKEIVDQLGIESRFILDPCITSANARDKLAHKFSSLHINVLDHILPHLSDYNEKYNLIILILRRLGQDDYDDVDALSNQELFGVRQLLSGLLKDKLEDGLNMARYLIEERLGRRKNDHKKVSISNNDTNKMIDGKMYDKMDDKMDESINDRHNEMNDGKEKSGDHTADSNMSFDNMANNERKTTSMVNSSITACDVLKKISFKVSQCADHFISTGNLQIRTNDILQTNGLSILAERINMYRFISHFESVNRGSFFETVRIASIRALKPECYGFLCPVHTPDGTPCGIILHMSMDAIVGRDEEVSVRSCLVGSRMLVVDGRVAGYVDDEYSRYLRNKRRDEGAKIEIVDREEAIYVFGNAGRLMRRVVDRGKEVYIGVMEQVGSAVLNDSSTGNVNDGGVNDGNSNNVNNGNGNNENDGNADNGSVNNASDSTDSISDDGSSGSVNHTNDSHVSDSNVSDSHASDSNVSDDGSTGNASDGSASNGSTDSQSDRNGLSDNKNDMDGGYCYKKVVRASNKIQYMRVPVYHERAHPRLLSYVASTIPFANYNQSPRNMYQCQMAKQAMAYPTLRYDRRTDNKAYLINCLQRPLVRTFLDALLGVNVYIAILSYTSYDMEDAMVINRAAIERGLFDGYVFINKVVERTPALVLPNVGDVIRNHGILYTKDGEHVRHTGEDVRVHRVRLTSEHAILTLRVRRCPQIGDKFCSRHGQKGVLSFKYRAVDMPFNSKGMVPDLIINPHAFPSRMTIGMMIEMLVGNIAVIKGERYDCTPFRTYGNGKQTYEYFCEQLRSLGYDYYGNETLYSGVTGRPLQAKVFTGFCYYQRLRHMVSDKWQVRSTGPVQVQTRQPIKGRKRGGGVRFGEMERDALIAHGCAYILSDRLMDCSDKTLFEYCDRCKTFLFCRQGVCLCGNKCLKLVNLPYVFKFLCTELLGMNIFVELEVGL